MHVMVGEVVGGGGGKVVGNDTRPFLYFGVRELSGDHYI